MTTSSSKIFFNHTKPQATLHKKNILQTIGRIIDSGVYLHGEQNRILEKKFLKFFKKCLPTGRQGYVTTVASGHDALLLALLSLNLKQDDEVIMPVNAYPTAFAVAFCKAKMVLVDVDYCAQIDLLSLEKKITKKTKAIIVVHLYGLVGNIEEIKRIAKNRHIVLIEDCAQALGSSYKNKLAGTFGDISCFSFYPTKNLGTLGDGGMLVTRHKKFYEYFLKAKSYGEKKRYASEFVSFHSRLPEIQAGILNTYYKNLISDCDKRKKLAKYYKKKLKELDLLSVCTPLEHDPKGDPIHHLFVCTVKKRDTLRKYLLKKGIETHIHYPIPVHRLTAFSHLKYREGDFPIAEALSKKIISLPFHPFLSAVHIDYIIETIRKFYYG